MNYIINVCCIVFSGLLPCVPSYRQNAVLVGDPGETWWNSFVFNHGDVYKSFEGTLHPFVIPVDIDTVIAQ